MGSVVRTLNKPWLVALVVGLVLFGFLRRVI